MSRRPPRRRVRSPRNPNTAYVVPQPERLLVKAHKLLRKHYEPVPRVERTLLDHLLFACLLENSSYASAEQGLATLRKAYFDLNEIRVSSVTEIAEHVGGVHDPKAAAWNLRRILQSVFEATYSFDIESSRKRTSARPPRSLSKFAGVSPFVLAYATQMSLDGHGIPIDRGAMDVLLIIGAVTPKEAEAGEVPGLERAIPKNKGIEFGSLLHQFGVDLLNRPFAQEVRDLLVAINPEAKDRLPEAQRQEGGRPIQARAAAKEMAAQRAMPRKPTPPRATGRPSRLPRKPPRQTPPPSRLQEKPNSPRNRRQGDAQSQAAREVGRARQRPLEEEKTRAARAKKEPAKSDGERPLPLQTTPNA